MTKQGLAIHLHHGLLIEWCYSFQERVDYILKSKFKSEQKIRLKLLKMLSEKAIADLPKYLVEADRKRDASFRKRREAHRKWVKARRKWEEARRKWIKAHHKWIKADRKWDEAYIRWINTKAAKQWHDKHCGCKEWSWEKNNL